MPIFLLKNKVIAGAFLLSLFFLVIGFSIAYVQLGEIRHLLIIHFDSYNGIDFLGSKKEVFGMLISGLVINIINLLLASALYYRQVFYSYLLAFSSVLVSLLILAAIIAIININ